MKTMVIGIAALLFSASGLAQTTISASSTQPAPAPSSAHPTQPSSAPSSVDALLQSINSSLRPSYHVYSADHKLGAVFTNQVLRATNGQITASLQISADNGYVAHIEVTADASDLDLAQSQGLATNHEGALIKIACKNLLPCLSQTTKVTALPENIDASISTEKPKELFLTASDEDSAHAVVQLIDSLLKITSDPSGTKVEHSASLPDSSAPSLDETLAYISSRLEPEDESIQYQNGRLTLQSSVNSQGTTLSLLTSVSLRNLDRVYYSFHKDCGEKGSCFWVFAVCKATMKSCVSSKTHWESNSIPKDWTDGLNNIGPSNSDQITFNVRDLDLAARLAKAFDHLIKLTSKEDEQADPFK